jgi:hypothetical protein
MLNNKFFFHRRLMNLLKRKRFLRRPMIKRPLLRRPMNKRAPIRKPPVKKPPVKKPPVTTKKHTVPKSVNNYSLTPSDLARNANSKALLIGINYYSDNFTQSQLYGSINDVYNIQQLLIARNFQPSNITMLIDTSNNLNTPYYPTRKNITNNLINLYKNGGSNIFFYYSGHGGKVDVNAPLKLDTQYGQLDYIVPCDFVPSNASSLITDLQIKNIINQHGHANQTASMFFDSCVNQTICNLKYGYYNSLPNKYPYQQTINNITVYINQTLTKSQVFEISGSTDKGDCLDSYNEKLNQPNGAYTMSFLSCFSPYTNIVYSWTNFLRAQRNWAKTNNYKQIPQLGSGRITNPDIVYINF